MPLPTPAHAPTPPTPRRPRRPARASPAPRRTAQPAAVKSEALFDGAAELLIDHRGVMYRLRQTSLGKLILTK